MKKSDVTGVVKEIKSVLVDDEYCMTRFRIANGGSFMAACALLAAKNPYIKAVSIAVGLYGTLVMNKEIAKATQFLMEGKRLKR